MDVYAGRLKADIQVLRHHIAKAEANGDYSLAADLKKDADKMYTTYKRIPKINRVMSKLKFRTGGGKSRRKKSKRYTRISRRKRSKKSKRSSRKRSKH